MVEKAEHWKITIQGPSIQGVMLREAIVDLKENDEELLSIKGFARNYAEHVEVIMKATEKQAQLLLEKIMGIPNSDRSMGIVRYKGLPELVKISNPENAFAPKDFEDFKVKRDGEQKEMMLALQGAGKLFRESADIQRRVSKNLEERDKNKVKGLLLSMYYENVSNREYLRGGNQRAISTVALQQAVMSPPIPTAAFVNELTEVFQRVNEYRNWNSGEPQGEGSALIKLVDSFIETLKKELEGLGIKL